MSKKRQTGRSTKTLLRALLSAIKGKDTIFVIKNDILSYYCDTLLTEWARTCYVNDVYPQILPNALRGLTFQLHRLKKGVWIVMRGDHVASLWIVVANQPRGPVSVYLDHLVMGQE
jgi:hypothetical protein